MGSAVTFKLEDGSMRAGFDALQGPVRESLARRMLVEGGVLLRDQAKNAAPKRKGRLSQAIYLVSEKEKDSDTFYNYKVSWNAKLAPHGHLIEFGHWRYNKIINGKAQHSLRDGLTRGNGPQDHEGPGALDEPVWVPADPFLRNTWDAYSQTAIRVMFARGQKELPILLQEHAQK